MPNVIVIPPTIKPQSPNINDTLKPKRRVAGYARVSTDRDEQFTSYEAQIAYYTRYIMNNKDWDFVGVYTDEGLTGTSTRRRRGFNSMVKDALAGKIDLIVTKSVSRFARNTVDSLVTIRKLKAAGCECYFEKENIFTFDGKGELLLTIMSSLAQEESRSISANVTWGMKESMRRGNAYVPYSSFLGYDRGEGGIMKINPEQAVTVRRIYGMYLQGMSPYRIASVLMQESVPSPTGNKRWFPQTVHSILTNEKYKGDALRQKTYTRDFLSKEKIKNNGELQQYYISGHHEAIITPQIFELVQKEIKSRKGIKETPIPNGKYPFSYKVKCGWCGCYYGPKIWHPNTASERVAWVCNGKYKKKAHQCLSPCLSGEELGDFFVSAVRRLFADRVKLKAVLGAIGERGLCLDGYIAERSLLEKELGIVREMLENADPRDEERIEEYSRRSQIAEHRMAELEGEISEYMRKRQESDAFLASLAERSAEIEEFEEELWYKLADCITVYKTDDVIVVFKDGTAIR